MQKSNAYKAGFLIVLGLFLVPAGSSFALNGHENIPCETCHLRTEAELTEYTYNRSDFPDSTLCLSCHDAYLDVSGFNPPHVINGNTALAGGSFTPTLLSDKAGHNIVAVDMTLGLRPPGGAPLNEFGCLSCHNAHANGNFRNLKKEINGSQLSVVADGDANYQETVYISGMNGFCSACHEQFTGVNNNEGTNGWRRHPVGVTIYGARHADFEHWSMKENKVTQTQHPSGSAGDLFGAEVFCLSCHRAHASPFNDAMRWDYSKSAEGCLECHTFN